MTTHDYTLHDDNTDPNITDPHISTEKRIELSVSFSVRPSIRENPVN